MARPPHVSPDEIEEKREAEEALADEGLDPEGRPREADPQGGRIPIPPPPD